MCPTFWLELPSSKEAGFPPRHPPLLHGKYLGFTISSFSTPTVVHASYTEETPATVLPAALHRTTDRCPCSGCFSYQTQLQTLQQSLASGNCQCTKTS